MASPARRSAKIRFSELVPIVVGHLLAVGTKPNQVLDLGAANAPPLEKVAAAQYRMGAYQVDEIAVNSRRARAAVELPIDPRKLRCPGNTHVVAFLAAGRFRRPPTASATLATTAASATKFLFCRSRKATTFGSSVSPSTPQFQLRFSLCRRDFLRRWPRCAFHCSSPNPAA